MKCLKSIISVGVILATINLFIEASFADQKTLLLTGDFYNLHNGEYVLSIEDVNDLNALDGKQLGFKIKQFITKDGKSEIKEEDVEILGVRQCTTKGNSDIIFNSIQKMLVPNDNNKTLTFKIGASGTSDCYQQLQGLISNKLYNKRENILVEYYDNRLQGDSTTTIKVMYKIGKNSSGSSTSSGFIVDKTPVSSVDNNIAKPSQSTQKKIVNSKILSQLKNNDNATVKLDKDSSNIVSKSLLSDLMYSRYKDKEIIFEKYDIQALIFRCIMPVNNIHFCEKFDIGISVENPELNKIVSGKYERYKVISFNSKDTLPAVCKFEIPIDFHGYDISKLKIYSVNLEKKIIEKKNMSLEVKDGLVIMTTGFGGDYIITDL